MALEFTNKIEAVKFADGTVALPQMTTEKTMRLAKVKFDTEENFKDALDILAECFGKDANAVRPALEKMVFVDLCKLQAYLLGGEEAVVALNRQMEASQNG